MRVSDVVFDENGARVSVHGKTGSRTVQLIASSPILGLYVQQHPFKNGDGPLWIHYGTVKRHKLMSYQATRETLIRIAVAAGITKRVHPHLFRHSAATRDGEYNISERILEVKYGWSKGSKMAARYTHIRDTKVADDIFLSTYAGKEFKAPEPQFRPLACVRCARENTPGMQYCCGCGTPLDRAELAKSSVETQEMKNDIQDIKKLLTQFLSQPSQQHEQQSSSQDQSSPLEAEVRPRPREHRSFSRFHGSNNGRR